MPILREIKPYFGGKGNSGAGYSGTNRNPHSSRKSGNSDKAGIIMKTTIEVPMDRWAKFTGEVMRIEGGRKNNMVINRMIVEYIKRAQKIALTSSD